MSTHRPLKLSKEEMFKKVQEDDAEMVSLREGQRGFWRRSDPRSSAAPSLCAQNGQP